MYYYSTDDRKRKWIGAAATVAYFLLWVVLMVCIHFSFDVPDTEGEGILINFGTTEQAGGEQETPLHEQMAQVPESSRTPAAQDEVITQDHEEAPAIETKKPKPTEKPAEKPVEKPREVNKRALFPGKAVGTTSSSEGESQGKGNQGDPAGEPDGSHAGTGMGDSGISFDLRGRRPVGEVRPNYKGNERGRHVVKVRVTVNPSGEVVSAVQQAQGSTTNSRSFVDEALRAARKQRFTPSDGENLQTGVITYVFNVR